MQIGTAEPISEEQELRKLAEKRRGGSGGGQKGGGGGGDGPGPDPKDNNRPEPQRAAPDKARIVTAFLLLVVMMTFAGLISAYVVIATNGSAEWRPFSLPLAVWISTTLILVSSFTYHAAKTAFDKFDQPTARRWLLATTALGGAFISSQLLAWVALVNRGLYMSGNPYAGFFYTMTALHAVHVLGGIVALGYILLRSWEPARSDAEDQYRKGMARAIGWYWHFMGALWIVLFVLLGFWH